MNEVDASSAVLLLWPEHITVGYLWQVAATTAEAGVVERGREQGRGPKSPELYRKWMTTTTLAFQLNFSSYLTKFFPCPGLFLWPLCPASGQRVGSVCMQYYAHFAIRPPRSLNSEIIVLLPILAFRYEMRNQQLLEAIVPTIL